MKLAAISDIHSNIAALEAVLSDIERRGIRQIVNLGDSLSGPFDARRTADRLLNLDLITVRGNHDRQLIDRPVKDMGVWEHWAIFDLTDAHVDWLKSLPLTATIGDVFLCHATPERDDENWMERRGKDDQMIQRDMVAVEERAKGIDHPVILCGHTHTPRIVRLADGRMIVNPGSVGCPAYVDTRMTPNFVHQTGAPDARYAVLEHVLGHWQVNLISVPYDASEMAELARTKGADNWAQAVTKGWFK